MFWAVLMARLALGLPFLVFGLNHFFKLFPLPQQPMPQDAMEFGRLLTTSGYMNAVKVLEVVGGALVVSGRLVPLGLLILAPIALNILFFEVFLVGQAGPGVGLVALCLALIWSYRSQFSPLFAVKPKIG